MQMKLSLDQKISQQLKLPQTIIFSHLMSVPDEVLSVVANAISYNPNTIETSLQKTKTENPQSGGTDKKIQTIYSSLIPSKGDASRKRSGIVTSPDLRALEKCLGTYQTIITPDATLIARKSDKPEVVFSDHLKGAMALNLLILDPSQYPETSKLLGQLRKFDEWKRSKLRDSYVILAGTQREYLEDFDTLRCNIFNQEDLAEELDVTAGTVSRILGNRWLEARNLAGEQKFFYAKDLFVTNDDMKRINNLPMLNQILKEEFESGKAFSDKQIAKRMSTIAGRTVTKYREMSCVPSKYVRNNMYQSRSLEQPHKIV